MLVESDSRYHITEITSSDRPSVIIKPFLKFYENLIGETLMCLRENVTRKSTNFIPLSIIRINSNKAKLKSGETKHSYKPLFSSSKGPFSKGIPQAAIGKIKKYLEPTTCDGITDNRKKCVISRKYRNKDTDEVIDCSNYCLEDITEWLKNIQKYKGKKIVLIHSYADRKTKKPIQQKISGIISSISLIKNDEIEYQKKLSNLKILLNDPEHSAKAKNSIISLNRHIIDSTMMRIKLDKNIGTSDERNKFSSADKVYIYSVDGDKYNKIFENKSEYHLSDRTTKTTLYLQLVFIERKIIID